MTRGKARRSNVKGWTVQWKSAVISATLTTAAAAQWNYPPQRPS